MGDSMHEAESLIRPDPQPVPEEFHFETSSLRKWGEYAVTWKDHHSLDDDLSVDEMERLKTDVEHDIGLANGRVIQQELAEFWERDGYDLAEIAHVTLRSLHDELQGPMRAGGTFGTISIQVLPWNHEKLLKGDPLGDCLEASGICERRETEEGWGFTITLSSTGSPSTVMHEVAHVLAFGDEGAFGHGPRWLMYFLLLMAGRYWEIDLPDMLTHMGASPASQVPSETIEVIDELEVAIWAETERPVGRFRDDAELGPIKLISQIMEESVVYRRLGGPADVEVTYGPSPDRLRAGETSVDTDGRAHIAAYDFSPWTALHELAHVMTYGTSHSRLWLDAYRELVRERYGDSVADNFDFEKAKAWLESES